MSSTDNDHGDNAESAGNKPIYRLSLGNISSAVFADEKSNSDGEPFTSHRIALQKTWKSTGGDFEDRTLYLDPRDVMKAITALQQAYLAAYGQSGQ